jgi:uncharacterized repeat protein (TIGR03803 family)
MKRPSLSLKTFHSCAAWTLAVFALSLSLAAASAAQTQSILYSFTNTTDGAVPGSGLISDAAGNLYGTAQYSSPGQGVVFRLSPSAGGGWTETVLYTFSGSLDGGNPYGGVAMDASGNLYGTTPYGGSANCGVVYKLKPRPIAPWKESVLHAFRCHADGANPITSLVLDSSGNIYGTTVYGGNTTTGSGTAFELSPTSTGMYKETLLHTFQGKADGSLPFAGLTLDSAGNLYGTTVAGGNNACSGGCGVVFELSKSSGAWKFTTLHQFRYGDGWAPEALLTIDSAGNLYGTTEVGGPINNGGNGYGVVFEVSPNGAGGWSEKTIYAFTGGADGSASRSPVIFDSAGNLYGANSGVPSYYGTIFKLTPDGSGGWIESNLYDWSSSTYYQGATPIGPIVRDAAGNIYGTNEFGGATAYEFCIQGDGCGTVFEVTP